MTALKKRLEDTERSMQRMMDMMNNMGIAMSQVTEQLTGESKALFIRKQFSRGPLLSFSMDCLRSLVKSSQIY